MTNSPAKDGFEQKLASGRPVVIDGGLTTQCEAAGCDTSGPLWSARLLEDDPAGIVAASRAFLDAGAEILSTASYQLSIRGCLAAGMDADSVNRLLDRSVELAVQARDEFMRDNPKADPPLIAASVGPYGAALADGSEYRGDYRVPARDLFAFHEDRLRRLDESAADILACETIPSYIEAQVLGELLEHVDTPAWVSFSCRDGETISDHTPIGDAVDLYLGHWRVLAVGVNCTPPAYVPSLIGRIRKTLPEKAVIVYPNSGETWDAVNKEWQGESSTTDWADAAEEWVRAGATLVGGCCRSGPDDIAAIVKRLRG